MPSLNSISPVLIANRGEIAARIAWTVRSLGLEAVGVYTEDDAAMPHVESLDRSCRISDYLNGEALIEAARRTGARSVHPGFGFLAENAGFAKQVVDAGLIWIGPGVDAIEVMGSKRGARQRVSAEGVSIVPGYDGEAQDDATLIARAGEVGFPLLVKASAGGGGKGMAVVDSPEGLPAALEQARRVSLAAFGDDQLLLERYIEGARHVEIQVLADMHGNTVDLLERECSIQRRRQKIVEEAPSPACMVNEDLRRRLCVDAIRAARSVAYVGAGTVEFMVTDEGEHFFLEMNTRLQVEHPVTEAVTGVDLVEQQLRVAAGFPLEFDWMVESDSETVNDAEAGRASKSSGHAIEVRIYAEEPERDYLPSTGEILAWEVPELPGVRVDSGVATGVEVGISYDPMLAKVIGYGRDREEARGRLMRALDGLALHGVRSNREQLLRILAHPAFVAGRTPTTFLERHRAELAAPEDSPSAREVALCATVLDWARRRCPDTPGFVQSGYRNNPWPAPLSRWKVRDEEVGIGYRLLNVPESGVEGCCMEISTDRFWTDELRPWMSEESGPEPDVSLVRIVRTSPRLVVEIDGLRLERKWSRKGETYWLSGTGFSTSVAERLPDFPESAAREVRGGCVAPMPGRIVKVAISQGESVEAGQELVVLEAMKMEQAVCAPMAGIVAEVRVEVGQQVDSGTVLLRLEGVDGQDTGGIG